MASSGYLCIVLLLFARMASTNIYSSITHYWSFNEAFPYMDFVTGESVSVIGDNPLSSYDHLSLAGSSCMILGSFQDLCLANLTNCNTGLTLAFWLQIGPSANASQIFLGTSNNGSDINGVFVYQTDSRLSERRIIVELNSDGLSWKVSLKATQEVWLFIVLTWNSKNLLRVHKNGELVNSTSVGTKSDQSLLSVFKLRALFSGNEKLSFLYLESGGMYDEVMTWDTPLDERDVKRMFQIQMNELSGINCTSTVSTLNITWRRFERNVFQNNGGYAVRVWKNKGFLKEQVAAENLDSSVTEFFVKDLDPFSSFKIRVWAKTSAGEKRVGALNCLTKEGVPTKVENVRIISESSTSLLVRWSPPAQINGILQGYSLVVEGVGIFKQITVRDEQKYLVTGLRADSLYAIAVDSYTDAGSGPQPHYKTARTRKVPTVTGFPREIHASALSWDTISVTWTPLDNQEEVTSYDIKSCSSFGCSTLSTINSSITIRGLPQYTSYTVKVRGKNAMNSGPWKTARDEVKTLDFDECQTGQHLCSALSLCSNTAGSYECSCMPGLIGDGYTCKEVPASSLDDFCKTELFKNISWVQTFKGTTAHRECPEGYSGSASRKCLEGDGKAAWQKPDLTKCVSKPFLELKSQLSSHEVIDSDKAVSLANSLTTITDPSRDDHMAVGDLHAAIDILETLGQEAGKNGTMNKKKVKKFMKNIVQVANNLLDGKVMNVWEDSLEESSSAEATKLLSALESTALMTATISNNKKPLVMETPHVVLNVQSFQRDAVLPDRLRFPRGKDVTRNSLTAGSSIEMPSPEIWRRANGTTSGSSSHVAFIYIKNIAQLLTRSSSSATASQESAKNIDHEPDMTSHSGVISLSINPETSAKFQEPVIITLLSNKSNSELQPSCVFWSDSGEGGSWSGEGCLVSHTNSSHTVCHCYHLTSFTVLMQYTPDSYSVQAGHKVALSLITYVGITISLVALVLALITFCSFTFLKSNRNFAHINLSFSLIVAELLFVVGIDKTQHQTGCFIIAVSLHYLFLVVFCWMATEGIILYLMLVKVFPASSDGPRKRVLFLCSWGIPVVPVGAAILSFREGYTSNRHCWLSIERGFIWSFLGPVVIICVVNIMFLGLTFKAMAERAVKQPARKQPQIRYWAKTCAVLTCLLGTTWLLGLFFVSKTSVVMAYLFNIFNVLQGLFIFIFHCLADDRIRAEYHRILCCRGSRRDYLRTKAVAKSVQNKTPSTTTTRINDKKIRASEGRGSLPFSGSATATRDSCGVVFGEQQPAQNLDRYLDISPLSETTGQGDRNSVITLTLGDAYQIPEIDEPGTQEDDDAKSVEIFGEDISLSLLNVRQDKENIHSPLTQKFESVISDPQINKKRFQSDCLQSRTCVSDMDFSSPFVNRPTKRKEHLYNTTIQRSPGTQDRDRFGEHCVTLVDNYEVSQGVTQRRNVNKSHRLYPTRKSTSMEHSSSLEVINAQIAKSESSDLGSEMDLRRLSVRNLTQW